MMALWIQIVIGVLALIGAAYVVGGIWSVSRSIKILRLWPRTSRSEKFWGAISAFALWLYFAGFADGYDAALKRRPRRRLGAVR